MDQNQSINQTSADDDLQRAIDNITNTTNIDPVFSDPVAAPSSLSDNDNDKIADATSTFSASAEMPAPAMPAVSAADNPSIPLAPAPAPEIPPMPEAASLDMPSIPEPMAMPEMPPVASEPTPQSAPSPTPATESAPLSTPTFSDSKPMLRPAPTETPAYSESNDTPMNQAEMMSVHQIKDSALRDLVPLLDRLNIDPEQKFDLYRNIFDELKDYNVLNSAYITTKDIAGDTERAEALLHLVETIDKL